VDAIGRHVRLVVHDDLVAVLHLSIHLQPVGPDLSQRLGEVFSLLNYWL
jgi:hypothetical protein